MLIYSSGGNGEKSAKVSIPSTIQEGKRFNTDSSKRDFRGEGLQMAKSISFKSKPKIFI